MLFAWALLSIFDRSYLYQVKSRYTTGAASRSFTSTSFDPVTKNEYEYVKVEKNPKKKGYVQLHTTHGDLNIELHCDITPRTCENFITLCERGYYDGVAFHRNIRYDESVSSCQLNVCSLFLHRVDLDSHLEILYFPFHTGIL